MESCRKKIYSYSDYLNNIYKKLFLSILVIKYFYTTISKGIQGFYTVGDHAICAIFLRILLKTTALFEEPA